MSTTEAQLTELRKLASEYEALTGQGSYLYCEGFTPTSERFIFQEGPAELSYKRARQRLVDMLAAARA